MSYLGKMDALDFIIEILLDHEKTLDELICRLESVLSNSIEKDSRLKTEEKKSPLENWL